MLALQVLQLGGSAAAASVVLGAFGLGSLLFSLPAGEAVARLGERRALVVAGLIDAAAMLLAWRTTNVAILTVLAGVSGATWAVYLLARQSVLIDLVPDDRRARAMSMMGGAYRFGLFVGPLVGALLIANFGLASVFAFAAVMSATGAALSLSIVDPPGMKASEPVHIGHVLRAHWNVLLTVGTAVILIAATRSIRLLVVPLWADQIGLSPEHTSLLISIAAVIDLALFYPSGWLMDRFGRTWVAGSCVAVLGAGVAMIPLTHTAATLLAVAAFMAVGNGLASGIVMTLGADNAPVNGRQQFLGAWRLCGDVGNTGGPMAVSAIAAVTPLAFACVSTGLALVAASAWAAYWVAWSERRRLEVSRP